jgi:hypothetical protein
MKLEENMYVRTNRGNIDKVLLVEYAEEKRQEYPNHPSKSYWRDKIFLSKERYWRTSQNIIKASHNIIDLIEVGDYVNGYIVLDIMKNNLGKTYIECGCKDEIAHNYVYDTFYEENIKSIVTKEQFEQMKYKVGE